VLSGVTVNDAVDELPALSNAVVVCEPSEVAPAIQV